LPRLKPGKPKRLQGSIPRMVERPVRELLRFSFKYIDLQHVKFNTGHCEDGYLDQFLGRLRALCGITVMEFRSNRSSALRSHPIDFSTTTECQGFTSLNEQLRGEEAWQFEITANKHGRIHGILLQDTFYVVWIDPAHKLYE
jgi:hypothetical protein